MAASIELPPFALPADGRPVYVRIAEQIRFAVARGAIVDGERLPAIREMAAQLGVNRDTISLAYDVLSREGLVEATVGRGTFIREQQPHTNATTFTPAFSPVVERLLDFNRARPGFGNVDGAAPLHSLTPDPSLYPVKEFQRSLNRALTKDGSELLVYGGHQGNQPLREVIAERLNEHGLGLEQDNVILCQGASQGISLAVQLYAQDGDWVAVEEPTYHNVLGVLTGLGLRATPVPMTPDGPDLRVLERALLRPEVKLFYTMPSFHNPMGTTTSHAHRRQLLAIANRTGKPVIEDAFEMDLRYDGRQVPPLAALDREGAVVHLFSFSKSLFPGVRVGSIAARGRSVEALLALKLSTDLSGVLILQAAVADFVRGGGYDRHLKRLRRTLKQRRDVLLESLAAEMPPGTKWTRPDGGYQIWVDLPGGLDSRAVLSDCQRAGVLFAPGYQFNHDGRPSNGLRLTTALACVDEIRRGVSALGTVVRRQLSMATTTPPETSIHV